MTEKGFILTSSYEVKEKNDKKVALIHLFGRLDSGKSFEVVLPYKPYFFIKTSDAERAKEIVNGNIISTNLKTLDGVLVSKIVIDNPKEVPPLRKILEDRNIPCFEADIRFTQRFLIDNDILSTILIDGSSKKGILTDLLFENPSISPDDSLNRKSIKKLLKILSFDIETSGDAKKIFSLSIHQGDFKKVLIVKNGVLEKSSLPKTAIVVDSEKDLLIKFVDLVKTLDPDIITGWHVIDFDLKVLLEKSKQYGLPLLLGRSELPLSLRIEKSFFRDSTAHLEGRLILDGIQLLKSSFIRLDDYKLNTAAKYFLNETKTIEADDRRKIIEEQYYSQPDKLVEYNLQDSVLVSKILDESEVIELTIQRSLLTGLHMDRVKASIASFDSLYLRELRKRGFVAKSNRPAGDDEGLGGFVMTSKPGIYSNILVLDFKSLYPSIMRTFNIDPLSYLGLKSDLQKTLGSDLLNKDKFIIAPNDAVFENTDGILPKILKKLWDEREKAKNEKNELSRYAIKILMNSMYGVLASHNSRFHNRNISNAITYFAQHIIKLTADKAREKSFEVIYGDTDSIFVNTKTDDIDLAKNIGFKLESELNDFLRSYVMDEFHRESILELEFEKQYVKFFMPKTRGSEKGAKKRYAGLILKDGKTKMEFTGLEVVRRDWTELAKVFQTELLRLIFNDEEVNNYIIKFVDDVKSGKFDDLLVYRKALRKGVDEYTKTTPPHVKAARLLKKIESNIIEYVMTIEGPEPVENISHPLDYDHYVEKQLKPIANSILEVIGTDFDEVLSGNKQKGLNDFFR